LPQATLELLARMPQLPPDEALALAVRNALADRTLADRPEVAQRILHHRRTTPQDPAGWSAQAAAGTGHALGEAVAAIGHPTLVLHGDEDRVVDVRNAALLGDLLPDARVVVQPGVGHLMFWDDPDRFVAELATFLQPAY
jgi:3-oxoadipate enol-lactonase